MWEKKKRINKNVTNSLLVKVITIENLKVTLLMLF